ncbi:hypothetical protein CQW23_33662 [Capsicum baccatum]|uniref:Protein TAR1 n=1 Tax=Capsicum baccatum TaxID=33114 RepID=A0A2G2V186_CAPBA|nr:hypothetical protein CQW23_33662 [Capsicum baccatum]
MFFIDARAEISVAESHFRLQKKHRSPDARRRRGARGRLSIQVFLEAFRARVCSHSNPSQKIKVGRQCTPRGDPTNQLLCALRVYLPVDSHTCQTPWSVFQDGSNGEPTGQRPKRADVEARRRRALPATIEETAFHERIESSGFGRPPNPRWSTPRVDRRTGSSPFHIRPERITGPHPLPSQ